MRVRILRFEQPGLIVKSRLKSAFTVAYGEILTAERLKTGRGLRLHTRTADSLHVSFRRGDPDGVEIALRRRGVRIVDCWGAIIAPTLADFEDELAVTTTDL